MTNLFICPKEAAKMLGLSTSTLAKWRVKKFGPKAYKVGNHRIRYIVEEVIDWVKTHN